MGVLPEEMLHFSDDLPCVDCENKTKIMQAGKDPIRVHTIFDSSIKDMSFFTNPNGAFQKALSFYTNTFLVKRRMDRIKLTPRCVGKEVNKNCLVDSIKCGPFQMPDELIKATHQCLYNPLTLSSSCKTIGSSGPGVDADFVLTVGSIKGMVHHL